jgi:threonine dehydrogenase-like Zn-dependent dehydrogenase
MKAYTNVAAGVMEWREWPLPVPGPGQVRIRTAACGICATDLEMIAGWDRTGFPSIPGHEWSGVVDAAGPDADAGLVGKPCVAENVLDDGGEVGFEHPGGYAEYLVTEAANVLCLPEAFPLEVAALIEPLAVCVHGWHRLGVCGVRRALVLGDGPIGLLMVALLRHQGFTDIGLVGGRANRLALGEELGATAALNYHEVAEPLGGAIVEGLGGPAPLVIEASGAPASMARTLEVAAPGAHVLVLGDYGAGCAKFRWNTLLHRELTLVGSNASAGAWPEAVHLATVEGFPLGLLVSDRLPVEAFDQGIERARTSRDALKIVMEWR